MRSASQAALGRAQDRWSALLAQRSNGEIDLGRELFAVVDVLRANSALTGALEDYSRGEDARARLAQQVFGGKVSSDVTDLVTGVVRDRLSEAGDLLEVLESLGVQTLAFGAQREGVLSAVEEELYVAMRTLRNERELRNALINAGRGMDQRVALARKVFERYNPYTQELIERAVVKTRDKVTLAQSLTRYMNATAAQGQTIVASVTSAQPLTREQEERLVAVLNRKYNTNVSLHVTLDPSVIGGLRIHVGNDVIDGTLASRIKAVREAFTN